MVPKRRDILARIQRGATERDLVWEFARQGSNHQVWKLDGLTIPIGNHRDFDEDYARMIYKECEPKLGKGWWRR